MYFPLALLGRQFIDSFYWLMFPAQSNANHPKKQSSDCPPKTAGNAFPYRCGGAMSKDPTRCSTQISSLQSTDYTQLQGPGARIRPKPAIDFVSTCGKMRKRSVRTHPRRKGDMHIPPRLTIIVPALGITQIIAWGSLYYSIAVLATPIARSLEMSLPMVFGAFSLSLAVSGLVSPHIGRAIDTLGGRTVMSLGAVVSAVALAVIALAEGPMMYFGGWMLAGIAMAANLYEAAFPTVNQYAGLRYRTALTVLTLFGGFASTVFWPLSWRLESMIGWRETLLIFAALHALVSLPLIRFALPAQTMPRAGESADEPPESHPPRPPASGFVALVIAFTLAAFVFAAIGAHVVTVLGATGLATETVILVATLIGPMQVVGRVIELVFARNIAAVRVGLVALLMLLVGMLLLAAAGSAVAYAFAFAACYGAANGVMTIVKGSVPAELFGRQNYGALMGRIARPLFLARASAPFVFALMLGNGGAPADLPLVLAGLMVFAVLSYIYAIASVRRIATR